MNFSKSDKLTILEMKVSEMKNLLIKEEIKAEELISIHIDQVEKFNKVTNAICTFIPDQAISQAKKIDLKIHAISEVAKSKIESAGGSVEIINE